MSKHLMKILSICAMVILLPLIIVGAALCITEAIPVTLTIYQGGNEGDISIYENDASLAPSAKISIFLRDDTNSSWIEQIDEEGYPVTQVSVQKNDEIKVVFSDSVGYDFQGWYKGSPTEYNENSTARETKTEYTFFIRGNTSLTAIRNVMTYSVQYTGLYNDGTNIADDENLVLSETVQYNEPLLSLSPKLIDGQTPENSAQFRGWVVEGSTGDVITRANFASSTLEGEAYTLTAIWSNQATVIYWNSQNQRIATHYFTAENYSSDLLDWSDEYSTFLTRGYQFDSWVNGSGEEYKLPESFTEGVYNIYIKETPIVYSNTIEKSAIDNTQTTLTYDVANKFADGVPFEREYYTFLGISYNGNLYAYTVDNTDPNNVITDYVYNGSSLGDIIVENGSVEGAYAVWQSNYANYEWQFSFDGPLQSPEGEQAYYPIVYYYDGTNYHQLTTYPLQSAFEILFNIADDNNPNSVQLEDKILDVYKQMKDYDFIDWDNGSFYADLDNSGTITEDERVVISNAVIYTNMNQVPDLTLSINEELTIGYVLNTLENYIPSFSEDYGDVTFDALTNIYITFNFTKVAE